MRVIWFVPVLAAALAAGCGDDPFTIQDALGVWDLEALNGAVVPGDRPTGVWVRGPGGGDSTSVVLESLSVTFAAGSACSWTFDDGISGSTTQTDCQYAVTSDGAVSFVFVDLFGADRAVTGTGERDVLTLGDQDTNVFELRKRI